MTTTQERQPRSRRPIPLLPALLALLATTVPVGLWWLAAGSSASFSDAEVLADNRLGAGTVDIEVGQTGTALSATNLAPGDLVTGHLELVNAGTLPVIVGLDAKLTSVGGDELGSWLLFEVWVQPEPCRPTDTTERLIDSVSLGATLTPLLAVGSGPDPHPELRLAPDDTTVLCVGARLPLAAPNSIQGARAEIDLVVNAVHDIEATIEEEGP